MQHFFKKFLNNVVSTLVRRKNPGPWFFSLRNMFQHCNNVLYARCGFWASVDESHIGCKSLTSTIMFWSLTIGCDRKKKLQSLCRRDYGLYQHIDSLNNHIIGNFFLFICQNVFDDLFVICLHRKPRK